MFLHGKAFVHIDIHIAAVTGDHNAVGFTLNKQFHSQIAHLGGVDTVTAGGNTAALNVTQVSRIAGRFFTS